MSKEAMKLALEALEYIEHNYMSLPAPAEKAITALRQALANESLDKKAENARELGLDYKPARQEPVIECDCETATSPDGSRLTKCGSDQMRRAVEEGHAFCKQPAQQQEPVAWINWCAATGKRSVSFECESELASQPLYEGIIQNTQYHYSKFHSWFDSELHRQKYTKDHPAYLAAQEAWNAANDAAQHRINRLNAEIEAWKVRFKIAEDALAKLNGQEQKPVAWVGSLKDPQPHCVTDLKYCSAAQWDTGYHLKYIPLYTSQPASKPWVGLTDEEIDQGLLRSDYAFKTAEAWRAGVVFAMTKLKEKNT